MWPTKKLIWLTPKPIKSQLDLLWKKDPVSSMTGLIFATKGPGLKLLYFEKDSKFCEISTLLLSYVVIVKGKLEILQNFVAFSEYMNFTCTVCIALA